MRIVFQSKAGLSDKDADKLLENIRLRYPQAVGVSYSHISGETVVDIGGEVERLIKQEGDAVKSAFSDEKGVRVEVDSAN